ncbi:MAG: ROK family protein [Bdellovibrionales bacterium]|nr:ROK family protein [Bdellovibrionales bacterium]
MQELWGIDLGGTKLEGIVLRDDSPVCRIRIDTEAAQGYHHILGRIQLLISKMEDAAESKSSKIGFATPGFLDPIQGVMKNCNTFELNGKPLKRDLENILGINAQIANDANCFTLAEATRGAAQSGRVVFGVILGTGVGGAVVIDSQVWQGAQGIAGEWGHNLLIPGGPKCYCGKSGCVEAVISGPALERYHFEISGNHLKLAEIAARTGVDQYAAKTITRLLDYFGSALAVVLNILDPDIVVVGGGVSNLNVIYDQLEEKLLPHLFNYELRTRIVKNALGDSAGVFGAAMLWAK